MRARLLLSVCAIIAGLALVRGFPASIDVFVGSSWGINVSLPVEPNGVSNNEYIFTGKINGPHDSLIISYQGKGSTYTGNIWGVYPGSAPNFLPSSIPPFTGVQITGTSASLIFATAAWICE